MKKLMALLLVSLVLMSNIGFNCFADETLPPQAVSDKLLEDFLKDLPKETILLWTFSKEEFQSLLDKLPEEFILGIGTFNFGGKPAYMLATAYVRE